MGSLTPGTTYIYERVDGVTYAREFGSSERRIIGWDFDYKQSKEPASEKTLWDVE